MSQINKVKFEYFADYKNEKSSEKCSFHLFERKIVYQNLKNVVDNT
jgi:hypothetical protein